MSFQACEKDVFPTETTSKNELFIRELYSNNRVKILAAEAAIDKSTNADVINFSNELLKFHNELEVEILLLAASKSVFTNKELLNYHRNNINLLYNYPNTEFNKQFVFLIRLSQVEALEILTEADANDIDDDFKLWGLEQLPKIAQKLDEAEILAAKIP
ncbi:hypothetical protein A5893_13130 [Pedobacter psychrophilus]|uniref:DUF4142 domain-containing protein n=2 Tax=Pedobacter psychrophilus TaxID=1826909 RepID=A0A179DD54_9SPHI|nr:hypothetical protein A5893_13130 [Pedobacter psychrophilus]